MIESQIYKFLVVKGYGALISYLFWLFTIMLNFFDKVQKTFDRMIVLIFL